MTPGKERAVVKRGGKEVKEGGLGSAIEEHLVGLPNPDPGWQSEGTLAGAGVRQPRFRGW